MIIWGIKTLSVRVGRGGGRWVGVWASPAVGQRQGRLGPARSRLAGTETGGARGLGFAPDGWPGRFGPFLQASRNSLSNLLMKFSK